MLNHILLYRELEADLKSRGYDVNCWMCKSPLTAIHPEHGTLEIDFYGENFRIEDDSKLWTLGKPTK
jgi:hypothetical protein